jgi:signal peptidase II
MEPPRTAPTTLLARRAALLAGIAACLAGDRVTKIVAEARLPRGDHLSLLGDTFRLELAHNPGAFLSVGARLPGWLRTGVFTWGVALVLLGALWIAFRGRSPSRVAWGAALVAAGGLGNLWDRVTTDGWVIDFMNLGVGPLRTGIFNVADVALVAGVVLLAWPRGYTSAATRDPST